MPIGNVTHTTEKLRGALAGHKRARLGKEPSSITGNGLAFGTENTVPSALALNIDSVLAFSTVCSGGLYADLWPLASQDEGKLATQVPSIAAVGNQPGYRSL